MKLEFSKHIKSTKSILQKLVDELSQKFEYVSVLATDVSGTIYDADFSSNSISDSRLCERGYVLRIFNGINYSEYSFDDLSENNYSEVLSQSIALVEDDFAKLKAKGIEAIAFPMAQEDKTQQSFFGEVEISPDEVSVKEKTQKLIELVGKAKKYCDKLVNFRVSYEEVNISKAFYSKEKCLEQTYPIVTVGMLAVVQKDGRIKYDYESVSGSEGYEILGRAEGKYQKLIDNALELLDAQPIAPGEYEVICDPAVSGLIAHEAFGHGVEMDMFVKNRAKGAEYVGKYVASEKTQMHDGAKSAKDVASYLFDDEGTLGTDTVIIKDGILETGISDILSAMALGTSPTGNGRRESFERKAYARMTNTFFAPGSDSLDDMIASIKYGYLLENYQSGMEDPKNWGIQCVIARGREIKDGKFTGKVVSPVMMTGYVPDILSAISMVSNSHLELFGGGYCGKGYKEWVKTSIGGTYLKTKARLG